MSVARRSVRHSPRGPAVSLATAALVVTAAAAFSWIAWTAPGGLPWEPHLVVRAELNDLSGLNEHNEIRIAGRRVGQVLNPRIVDGRPVVDLQLDDEDAPLPADTSAIVRSQGLLGQRYLELRPGTSRRRLREGDTIPASRTDATVDIPEFLSAFDEPHRTRLRSLIDEFGTGLAGRGNQLNAALDDLPTLLHDLRATSHAVLGRKGAAARFFPSLRSGASAFDPVRDELAAGFEPQARALRPFVEQSAAVRRALDVASVELPEIRAGLRGSQPLLAEATSLARVTSRALDDAPSALAETSALLEASRIPLRRAAPLMRRIADAGPPTLRLTDRVDPLIPPLTRSLRGTTPILAELARRPCDVIGFAANWRSMLEWGVPGGGEVGPLNVTRITLLGTAESLGQSREDGAEVPIGSNPYPAPCEAGDEVLR